MDLYEELLDELGSNRRPLCTIARIKTHLSDEECADLERAFDERVGGQYRIEGEAIARRLNKVLGEKAYNVKGQTVQRHRNRGCDCQ